MILVGAATLFIVLTGPDHQVIEVNPAKIVSLRAPRHAEHFAPGTRCLVFTADAKYLSVMESCQKIETMLKVQ